MHDHPCEYCEGHVQEKILASGILRVGKDGYVILQSVPVGVCNRCGMRYYHASVLKRAEEAHRSGGSSTRQIPVAPFQKA
jgi:YgiT-type zinc finger domain-containing protein